MNSLKLIAISSTIIISLTLLLFIIYLLTKKFKSKINLEGKLKTAFGIWYTSIFLSGASIISNITSITSEVLDNLTKIRSINLYVELVKTVSLVIGAGFIWLILWFFVVTFLTKIIPIKTDETEEMEDDCFGYFMIKGAMLIGIIFSLSPILSLMLRTLIPNIEVPFYH